MASISFSSFHKGGRLRSENLLNVLPKGATIRGSLNLPGSVYLSGFEPPVIKRPTSFIDRVYDSITIDQFLYNKTIFMLRGGRKAMRVYLENNLKILFAGLENPAYR
jgi:hypothetical protein